MGKKNEVEVYSQKSPVTAAASFDLQQWGRDAALVASVAENLVKTSFVPQSYSGRALEATAAILTGQEIGLKPMASLRSIDVIKGTPAMRAVALRALVQAAGHEIWTEESTATRAVVAGQRRGSSKVERSEWTIDRARGLQLLSKDNWKQQPIAMLLARATSECVRLVAADVILGIPYSVEEIQDLGVVESDGSADAPRQAPKRTTARRKPLPAKPEEPALDDDVKELGTLRGEGVIEASEPAEDEPVFDDELAAKIAADLAAERAAAASEATVEEPELEWDVEGMTS